MTLCEFLVIFFEDFKNHFYNPACPATEKKWDEAIVSLENAVQQTHEYLSGFEKMQSIPSNPTLSSLWKEASLKVHEINESLSDLLDTKIQFYLGAEIYFQENKEQFVYKLHDANESLQQLKHRLHRRYDTTYFQNHR